MAFKMKGWNSPLNNYKTGYFGEGKSKPLKKTYAEAYKTRDMSTYGDLSQEEYTTEAKRQNKIFKETGRWDWRNAPKKETVKDTGRTKKVKLDTATGSKTTKTVTDKADTVRKVKTVEKDTDGDITKKTKEKFDKKGDETKRKVTLKGGSDVTKIKTKDKKGTLKTKTRKKGGTGIGAAIKTKLAERKAKRAKNKK